jgi:hypothetical protein
MSIGGNNLTFWINELKEREMDRGGFALKLGGDYRPDATCWAILALLDDPGSQPLIKRARDRLAKGQLPDGRVCLSPDHPEAYWPTSLAVLAWRRSPEYRQNQDLAVHFLTTSSGKHWPRKANSPVVHDTGIPGWSWIAGTHSWVEPTGLAMMALRIAGDGDHARVKDGARLLLDRQLPQGGWNYGNTLVFGQELRPMPLSTGLALSALKGETHRETVQKSLSYLQKKVETLRTPQSLGWSLLGLGAWQVRPVQAQQLIHECLNHQGKYGVYDTSSLALMLLAGKLTGGLEDIFSGAPKP